MRTLILILAVLAGGAAPAAAKGIVFRARGAVEVEALIRAELRGNPDAEDELGHALNESLNLWPLFTYDRHVSPAGNELRESWDVLWPFFGAWEDEYRGEWGFAAPWPLIAGTFGDEHTHLRLAPIFYWWRWKNERALFVFPLGGGTWNPESWMMLLPFFYSQHDADTDRSVLFPLLWLFDEPKGGCVSLWPAWTFSWRTRPEGAPSATYLDLAPLSLLPFGAWDAEWAGADHYWSVGWPLGPTYMSRGDSWGFRFLWEGFVAWSDGPDHFEWRVLGGLIGREARYHHGRLESQHWTLFWIFQFGVHHDNSLRERLREH